MSAKWAGRASRADSLAGCAQGKLALVRHVKDDESCRAQMDTIYGGLAGWTVDGFKQTMRQVAVQAIIYYE